jgi:hypothetical protein
MEFTGSSARIGISLPADMLEYLLQRKRQEGIPVSAQIQRAIEADIMDRAAARHDPARVPAGTLVDPDVDYETD